MLRCRSRLGVRSLEERAVPATFTVSTTTDSGPGSFRQALLDANAAAGTDSVVFDSTVFASQQLIILNSQLSITDSVTVAGPAAGLLVSGNNTTRIMSVSGAGQINVSLSKLTMTNGRALSGSGGAGISVADENLTIVDCTISNCTATVGNGGGILFYSTTAGSLSLTNCTLSGNSATASGGDGGGASFRGPQTVVVRTSSISGNSAADDGAGLAFYSGGSLLLESSTVSGNTAALSFSDGGGVVFAGAVGAAGIVVRNSTISGNIVGGYGGGMFVTTTGSKGSTVRVQNSTVTANVASKSGGGLGTANSALITYSLESSIVSNNTNATAPDILAQFAVIRRSALGSATGVSVNLIDLGNNLIGANLALSPLASNGGPTKTHALQSISPAIDVGDNFLGLGTDQRSGVFPRSYGTTDIGAYEYVPAGKPWAAMATVPDFTTAGAVPMQFAVTFSDDTAIDVSTLGNSDIRVNGPAGFQAAAKFVSVDVNTNGTPRIATYEITAPGGTWDAADNGTYTFSVEANQVGDTSANMIPFSTIGAVKVSIGQLFVVTSSANSGAGTLRQAILDANALVSNDTISFNLPTLATITLTSTATITDALSILGPGADKLTVNGGGLIRPLTIDGSGVFTVNISNLTITGGSTTTGGGLFVQDETVAITDVVFNNNKASVSGGAITSGGLMSLLRCRFDGNMATGASSTGGAIRFTIPSTFQDCSFTNNTAGSQGGALMTVYSTGNNVVFGCTFVNNKAIDGGAVYNIGPGVYRNSTFANNTATKLGGAIYFNSASANPQNCTIVNNSAGTAGGGLYDNGISIGLNIPSCVITGNSSPVGPDISATVTVSLTNSAVGSPRGFAFAGSGNLAFGADVRLGPLQDNGGPTLTMLPLPGSPLRDRGSNPSSLLTDQRGQTRVQGAATDIGAVESVDATGTPVAVAALTNVSTTGGSSHQFSVTLTDNVAIDISTIGSGDVRVTGPNGFDVPASLVGIDVNSNGTPRIATFSFAAPGGVWDPTDFGVYSVVLQPGVIADTSSLAIPDGVLGQIRTGFGTTFVVTNTSDSGPGSLRDVVGLANENANATDTITFDTAVFSSAKTILLSTGELLLTDPAVIQGPGMNLLTIDGNKASRAFRFNTPTAKSVFSVSDLSIANGTATTGGGIQIADESLTLTRVSISGCTTSNNGGAINIDFSGTGPVTTLESCVLTNNFTSFGSGGAIEMNGNPFMIRNCQISNNTASTGGALFSFFAASVVIENTVLSGNTATGTFSDGGAMYLGGGPLTMTGCTVSGNKATDSGGGITVFPYTGSGIVIDRCLFANNSVGGSGGGIWLPVFSGSIPVTIRNSTISGNTAAKGGGIATDIDGTITIRNCTITANVGTTNGGGIAGISGTNTFALESTIVSNNFNASTPDFSTLSTITAKNCAIGSKNGATTFNDLGGNLTGIDFKLAPLANNGGPTLTHRLLPGSPCINAGSNPGALTADQRGPGYARSVGVTDIGAFEVQPPPTVFTVDINDGAVQRSRVTSVKVTFNQLVTLPVNPADAFQIMRQSDNVLASLLATVNNAGQGTVVTLTFTGTTAVESSSLADGRYTLTIDATKVANTDGANLDGNADGTGGDSYVLASAAAPSPPTNIFRLFGDSDGDGTVAANDFIQFRLALGGTSTIFDFDNDGAVAASDFIQFRLRFGGSI